MEGKYERAINLITSQEKFHICLGLERISSVMELLGNPQKNLKVIHIAGTNGKGSVSVMLSKILTTAGYKTGLYTSPHILNYTERIKINQIDISRLDFADLIEEISDIAAKNNIYLTEFELLTAAAYKYFSDKETDICVVETGLGGRLDATSVIDENLLSVITSISLDHVDRLGDTVEKIAYEKAGIIKQYCPVLISKDNSGLDIILECAKKMHAKYIFPEVEVNLLFENNKNYALINNKKYEFGMLGLWQKDNLKLVIGVIDYLKTLGYEITDNCLRKALENVKWPCRMQYISKYNLLLDGSHNPDGAKLLRESLDYYFPNRKIIWVYGSLNTKDYKNVTKNLFNLKKDEVFFYEFENKNSVNFEKLNSLVKIGKPLKQKALEYLICENKNDLIVISGSFYMLGDIINSNNFFQNIAWVDNII